MRDLVRWWGVLTTAAGLVATAAGAGATEELKRRGFFGAQLAPAGGDAKAGPKSDAGGGAEVRRVFPESAAEAGGVKAGDVLRAVDGAAVKGPGDAVAAFAKGKAGDVLTLDLVRDGEKVQRKVTLKERPRESSEAFETVYGSVDSKAGRLRTILTRPRPKADAPARHPGLLMIQGLGCGSVEGLPGQPSEFQRIAAGFTEAGYVTLRVEKPGCGDSEGGPCEDVDFLTELDGYRQGLKALKARDDVDRDNVLLFGQSLGGLWAPLLAAEDPVKGVAVYGTVLKPWYEYELENRRRQLLLDGQPFPEVDRQMRAFAAFLFHVYLEKTPPLQVAKDHPELAEIQSALSPDGAHIYGRSVAFMRQVAALPVSEAWSKVDAHVLAAWGKAEYVSTEADHRQIADLVNRRHPGRGTFLAVDDMDHGFQRARTPEERFHQVRSGAPSEFNPRIIDVLRGWADSVVR